MSRKFLELLKRLQNVPLDSQKGELLNFIMMWIGREHFQIDDVLITGVREE